MEGGRIRSGCRDDNGATRSGQATVSPCYRMPPLRRYLPVVVPGCRRWCQALPAIDPTRLGDDPASASCLIAPTACARAVELCSRRPDAQWRSILFVTPHRTSKPGIMYGASNAVVHAKPSSTGRCR